MPLAAHTVGSSFRIESLIGWTSEYEKKVFQDLETLPESNKSKEILEVSTTGQSQARSMATQYNILGRRLGNTEKSKRGRTEYNISNHENWSNITECQKAEETEWDSRSMPSEDQCEILECTQQKDSVVCAKKMITEKKIKVSEKPNHSYIALISTAILSSPEKKLQLSDIYQWIMETYPYYHNQDKSWRNSVRHNLSLNECFIKAGRSDNGKGHYWAVHPANLEAFSRGDYQRRRARRRARRVSSVLGYSSHFHVCTVRCFHRLCILCSPFYSNSDLSHICPFVGPTSQQVNCPFRMPLLWPWYQIPPYP